MRSYEPVKGEISLRSGEISPSRDDPLPYERNFKNISKLYVRRDPVKSGPARLIYSPLEQKYNKKIEVTDIHMEIQDKQITLWFILV